MFVFFKPKTAYQMRISDWSSDVCSFYLNAGRKKDPGRVQGSGLAGAAQALHESRRYWPVDRSAIDHIVSAWRFPKCRCFHRVPGVGPAYIAIRTKKGAQLPDQARRSGRSPIAPQRCNVGKAHRKKIGRQACREREGQEE